MPDEQKPPQASGLVGQPKQGRRLNTQTVSEPELQKYNEHEERLGGRVFEVTVQQWGYGPDMLERGDLIRPSDAPRMDLAWAEQNGVIRHAPEHAARFAQFLEDSGRLPRTGDTASRLDPLLATGNPRRADAHPELGGGDSGAAPADALPEWLTPEQRESLGAAGVESLADVRDASDEDLLACKGVGDGTLRRLRAE